MPEPFDLPNHQGPLPSPCTSVCVMDSQTGFCQGCRRTIDEIMGWSIASQEQKRSIWLALKARQ